MINFPMQTATLGPDPLPPLVLHRLAGQQAPLCLLGGGLAYLAATRWVALDERMDERPYMNWLRKCIYQMFVSGRTVRLVSMNQVYMISTGGNKHVYCMYQVLYSRHMFKSKRIMYKYTSTTIVYIYVPMGYLPGSSQTLGCTQAFCWATTFQYMSSTNKGTCCCFSKQRFFAKSIQSPWITSMQ